jgi:hypothetical protein
VRRLQRLLVELKILSFDHIDGTFGSATETAVKDFQLGNALTAEGSRLCLGSQQRSSPPVARPDRAGRAVTALACRVLLLVIAVSSAWLTSSAQERTKDGSYKNEGTARTCIHTRLTELIGQNRPNIAGDTVLTECTKGLQVELKDRQKSYCDAVSYTGWLIADENSKLNGLKGQSYQPDKASIQRCERTYTWEKHP